ncbi:MAG TPA: type IV pilus assembly protein PilM [Candidatus Gastranaerophilales bacterium]|nr:type IV pilus assembly protein PilM [Candidatus Gastranaerophilales bacterium]
MINLFKKSSEKRIGLEISSEGITMVFFKEKNKKKFIENYIYKPFLKQIIQNDQIENFEELTETLKSIINEYKPDTKNTIISMPSSSVFIKRITLPDLPKEELKTIAPQEASKHLPLTMKELNVDFHVLENTRREDESGKKVDVILCAISKTIVRSYLDAIYNAGLSVSAVDISAFAMITALANAEIINDPEKTYISVLIDYDYTDINVIQNGMPVFSHNLRAGKKNIMESITNSVNKKKEEILEFLPEVALMIPGSEISENPDLSKASNAAKNIYSNITAEIQKTIEFFNSSKTEPVEIERIILGGSGVCVQNIDKYIQNKLKIQTCVFNPFINLSEELQNQENLLYPINIPLFSTSIGLALKGF